MYRHRFASLLALGALGTLCAPSLHAQDNVRAWSDQGQVWVVWEDSSPVNQTYKILSNTNLVLPSVCSAWTEEARVFGQDARVQRLREQNGLTSGTQRASIPDGSGGIYQLGQGEYAVALTPHADVTATYAVLHDSDCAVSVDRRSSRVSYVFDPIGDPVQPVLQVQGSYGAPTLSGTVHYRIYCLWADGRQDETDNRSDFPVMANRARNATPHLFIVYADLAQLGENERDLVHFLHGGGGNASKFRPGNGPGLNLIPQDGFLVSHDDALYVAGGMGGVPTRKLTYWFGYHKGLDPFTHIVNNTPPGPDDLIVNYTQRRILWINNWMIEENEVLAKRCALMGFSVGSHGVSHLARSFPEKWSSATLLNHNPRNPADHAVNVAMFGPQSQATPTNLVGPGGAPVTTATLWDFNQAIADVRDYPVMRLLHGTNDNNGLEGWDQNLMDALATMNASGLGFHFYWDGRAHATLRPDAYWSEAPYGVNDKIERSNIAFQRRYVADRSYPAFFNVELDLPGGRRALDPNTDPIGTWSGFIEWNQPLDTPTRWFVDAKLIDGEYSLKDRAITSRAWVNMTLRKPQAFLPAPGSTISFRITNPATGVLLNSGSVVVGADGLVRLNQDVVLRRGGVRRIEFRIP